MSKSQGNGRPANRSDAVREELARNPKAKSKEVIAALAGRGVRVSPTLVYYVKSRQNHTRRRAKRARVAEATRQAPQPLELVLRLKELAREVGGFRSLMQLVDMLAE